MSEIQYLTILKKSFSVSWKNKFWWLFGFLIFLGAAVEKLNLYKENFLINTGLGQYFNQGGKEAISMSLLLLVIILVFFYVLRILSSIALIRAINNPVLYKQLKYTAVFFEARNFLGRLAGLDCLLDFTGVVIFLALLTPIALLFSLKAVLLGTIVSFVAFLILAPLLILIFFLKKFSFMALVLADLKVREALEIAYEIFLKQLKQSLLMGLSVLTTGLGVLLLLILIVLPLTAVNLFVPIVLWPAGVVVFVGLGLIFLISLVFSVYIVFVQVVWLNFFSGIAMQKSKNSEPGKEKVVEENEILSPDVA